MNPEEISGEEEMSQDEVYLDGKWVKFASLSEAKKNAIIASRRVPDKNIAFDRGSYESLFRRDRLANEKDKK